MNEHNAFETELAALKPQPPSPDLKSRISQELQSRAQPSVAPKQYAARRVWRLSLALGLALAVLVVISMRRREQHPIQPPPSSLLEVTVAFDPSLPTVWTYHRAVCASPQEMDALLDRHSRTAPTPATEFHVSAFPMSQTDLQSF